MPSKPSVRSTGGAFSRADTDSFLAGEWVACASTWILRARYDETARTLYLGLKGGGIEPVPCGPDEALDFAQAPSKGGFLWDLGWRPRR